MERVSSKLSNDDFDKVEQYLKDNISEKRYAHILGVKEEIGKMGEYFLPNEIQELQVAALLHDITKEYSLKKQLQLCERFGIILDNASKESEQVIHSKTGAYLAKELFPEFVSEKIFSAIYKHTLASENMSTFDKLLYLSDFTEKGRKNEFCIALREMFWSGFDSLNEIERQKRLNEVLLYSLEQTILRLKKMNKPISKETVLARDWLLP